MYTPIVPNPNDQRSRESIVRAAGLPRIPTTSDVIEQRSSWLMKLSPVHPVVNRETREQFYGFNIE